jgi:hypothetical protein
MTVDLTNAKRAEILTEALPYIRKYNGKIIVIKYGGNAMVDEQLKAQVMEDVVLLSLIGVKVVLVHGGGPEISATLQKLGKQSVFVDGLRVTDRETVDVVQMVLAGKINKTLVNLLELKGGKDDTGKEYIDLGSGIAVNIFGMQDAPWKAAVEAQLDKFQHTSNLYFTAPCAELAQLLCEKTGMKKVFFSQLRRGGQRVRHQGRAEVRPDAPREGLLYDRHAREQLPRPHGHDPGRDRAGALPRGLPAPHAGLRLRRGQQS